jgi:hypothetical protein
MDKDPMEMTVEELDALYGKPHLLSKITHVLGCIGNIHHDRFTVEVITEDSKRAHVQFTQTALRNLMRLVESEFDVERPKAN